jgi:hypothetical protein
MVLVRPAIPRAWQIADPSTILAARLEAVDGALRRLWGTRITSAAMVEAASLAREAAACDLGGRVLSAAHAALPWPQPAHLLLWHALNLLREHRGDGHIISLVGARLDAGEATATLIASAGEDQAGRRGRWSDEAWHAAVGRLQARGWLDAHGHPTAVGRAGRDEVERSTDQLAMRPWEQLGRARTHRLWALLHELVDVITAQNGVPLRTPLGGHLASQVARRLAPSVPERPRVRDGGRHVRRRIATYTTEGGEGFDTAVLQDTKVLLEERGG